MTWHVWLLDTLDTFGYLWILLDTFGYFWILLDTFGCFWILSDTFGLLALSAETISQAQTTKKIKGFGASHWVAKTCCNRWPKALENHWINTQEKVPRGRFEQFLDENPQLKSDKQIFGAPASPKAAINHSLRNQRKSRLFKRKEKSMCSVNQCKAIVLLSKPLCKTMQKCCKTAKSVKTSVNHRKTTSNNSTIYKLKQPPWRPQNSKSFDFLKTPSQSCRAPQVNQAGGAIRSKGLKSSSMGEKKSVK